MSNDQASGSIINKGDGVLSFNLHYAIDFPQTLNVPMF